MACARIADEKKGRDIAVRQVAGILDIADYFVLASGSNRRQVQSIAEEIGRRARREGWRARIEGQAGGWWALLDFGAVVVHVFQEEARRYYDLDLLWADAPLVEWAEVSGARRSASAL